MLIVLYKALQTTCINIIIAGVISSCCGFILGNILFLLKRSKGNIFVWQLLNIIIDTWLNLPAILFFILGVFILKYINFINLTIDSISLIAIIMISIPVLGVQIYKVLITAPSHLLVTAKILNATIWQSLTKIYLPELFAKILRLIIGNFNSCIHLAILSGLFGARGLGSLLLQQGYYDFNIIPLLCISAVIILLHNVVKLIGKLAIIACQ